MTSPFSLRLWMKALSEFWQLHRRQSHMYLKSRRECELFLLECKNRKFVFETFFQPSSIHCLTETWHVFGQCSSSFVFTHPHLASRCPLLLVTKELIWCRAQRRHRKFTSQQFGKFVCGFFIILILDWKQQQHCDVTLTSQTFRLPPSH